MGFYTEYFSTLFKGIRITALKERVEIRRVINGLRKSDHILYKSLWEDVEKMHMVTHAIKEEEKLLGALKKSSENAYSLVFNLSTEEKQLLQAIGQILKELEEFSHGIDVSNPQLKQLERELSVTIFQALNEAEKEIRKEYRQVELVINESKEKNTNLFMANIRLAFQTEQRQTLLAKFAARSEIRKSKTDILLLQKISSHIRAVRIAIVGKDKGHVDASIRGLRGTIQEIKVASRDAFHELYYLQMRAILLTLKILFDLNSLKNYNARWGKAHFMPAKLVDDKAKEINKIEDGISKHFHTIAQAFRIIISKIKELEQKAERAA